MDVSYQNLTQTIHGHGISYLYIYHEIKPSHVGKYTISMDPLWASETNILKILRFLEMSKTIVIFESTWKLVIEPTRPKNMLGKLDHFAEVRGENSKYLKPPPSSWTYLFQTILLFLVPIKGGIGSIQVAFFLPSG